MRTNLWNKVPATAFSIMLALSLGACGGGSAENATTEDTSTEAAQTTEQTATEEGATADAAAATTDDAAVMNYADYAAAAVDDPVTIEAYVQGKQAWWQDKATLYLQDKDGAYFVFESACTEDDYAKLADGIKVKVSGYKANFNGEDEIADATVTIEDDGDTYIAEPVDVTDKLESEDLISFQNQKVAFKGLTVAASKDPDGNEVGYLYGYDGSGTQGDDLYFNVSDGTNTYTFTVESYLCDKDTDVYKAVEGLKVGDVVDLEGFLYWYEGANPHITSVTVQ
ncbi:MAG: hypothetical protein IKF14_10965 [Atopobiaceae bacterium]|nr:hypothetical protein [Atopobiaceae bacterium]